MAQVHVLVPSFNAGELSPLLGARFAVEKVQAGCRILRNFIPHVHAGDPLASGTPVILTDSDDADLPHHHVLINLSARTPAHFARFERMFEIISSEDGDKAAGRERYRFYQQRGYPLTHFVADQA